jgi:hypothetical protein
VIYEYEGGHSVDKPMGKAPKFIMRDGKRCNRVMSLNGVKIAQYRNIAWPVSPGTPGAPYYTRDGKTFTNEYDPKGIPAFDTKREIREFEAKNQQWGHAR